MLFTSMLKAAVYSEVQILQTFSLTAGQKEGEIKDLVGEGEVKAGAVLHGPVRGGKGAAHVPIFVAEYDLQDIAFRSKFSI